MATTVGKITVSSGPVGLTAVSAEVDGRSWFTVDGRKVGSGGDRPHYDFGPSVAGSGAVGGQGAAFREYGAAGGGLKVPDSEITSMSLSGSTLTVLVVTNGVTETTTIALDALSVLKVEGPTRTSTGGLNFVARLVTEIPLALAGSISYVPAVAPS